DDDLAQLVHVGPVNRAFLESLHKVPGFNAGLILAVHDDRFAAAYAHRVDLGLADEVGANGVNMRSLRDPVAVEHRLAASRGRDDDVLVFRGHLGTRHRLDFGVADAGHLVGETAAVFLGETVNLDAANLADLAHRLELRACLLAAAENADTAGVRPGHILRGHAAGRAGAHLAQISSLHS